MCRCAPRWSWSRSRARSCWRSASPSAAPERRLAVAPSPPTWSSNRSYTPKSHEWRETSLHNAGEDACAELETIARDAQQTVLHILVRLLQLFAIVECI